MRRAQAELERAKPASSVRAGVGGACGSTCGGGRERATSGREQASYSYADVVGGSGVCEYVRRASLLAGGQFDAMFRVMGKEEHEDEQVADAEQGQQQQQVQAGEERSR